MTEKKTEWFVHTGMWVSSDLAQCQTPCKACWLIYPAFWSFNPRTYAKLLPWTMPWAPQPIHKGELSLILDYIPQLWSQYPQGKARLTVKRRQGTATPPPPHPPAGPECLWLGWVFSLRHLISSQMTVTARTEVSPEQQGHLGLVSSVCKCSFVGSGGVKWGEGVDKHLHNRDLPSMTYHSFPNQSSHFVQA